MTATKFQSPAFPAIKFPHLAGVILPPLHRVRIKHPEAPALQNLEKTVDDALESFRHLQQIPKRSEVAIAVGSRGIAQIDTITRTVVSKLKSWNLKPFIVPAMGSHGGGTSEGQQEVLRKLGIDGMSMGCEIRSSMKTLDYGLIAEGIHCHFDANAAGAAGIILINRVKAHTSFPRKIESGLIKLIAVGLGKAEGARSVHRVGPKGLQEILPKLAEKAIQSAPIKAGIALIENANREICHVEPVQPEAIFETEQRLLQKAKGIMPRLPFDQLDALIVEEFGKEISGAGLDPHISGRTDIRGVENPASPFIHKIAALRMTAATNRNGMGTGMVDFLPQPTANKLDLHSMYINAVSSTVLEKAFLPIVLANDQEVIRALVATCWQPELHSIRLAQIRSTLHLNEMLLTTPLFQEAQTKDAIDFYEEQTESLKFDSSGQLMTKVQC
jgi:hypothetical protein